MFKFIGDRLQDLFWISYILFIVFTPVVALGIFITGLYSTFFA